jgi:hypothetical protein
MCMYVNWPVFLDAHRINESSVTAGSLNNCERNTYEFCNKLKAAILLYDCSIANIWDENISSYIYILDY